MSKTLRQAIFSFKGIAKDIPQPIVRALNKTAEHIKVLAAKEVSKNYTIKQKDAKQMMVIRPKANASNFNTAVHVESRLLTPYHFKYTPTSGITVKKGTGWKNHFKRPTTTVTIKNGNKQIIKHAFVAVVRGNRNVFMRNGKKLISFRSASLPQMIANPKVASIINKDMAEFYEKKFIQEFNFVSSKAGFK